jgi:hypothetical protein
MKVSHRCNFRSAFQRRAYIRSRSWSSLFAARPKAWLITTDPKQQQYAELAEIDDTVNDASSTFGSGAAGLSFAATSYPCNTKASSADCPSIRAKLAAFCIGIVGNSAGSSASSSRWATSRETRQPATFGDAVEFVRVVERKIRLFRSAHDIGQSGCRRGSESCVAGKCALARLYVEPLKSVLSVSGRLKEW